MTGEEWMINRPGAYLPDVYEEVRKWFTIQNIIDAFPPRTQCRDFDDFKYQKRKKMIQNYNVQKFWSLSVLMESFKIFTQYCWTGSIVMFFCDVL